MDEKEEEELDVTISNVVATFRTGCHLNLYAIACNGHNVIHRPERGTVTMQLRKPRVTANIWSSGKVICTGATSEQEAKMGARRIARCVQKLNFPVSFSAFKVVNVMVTSAMPFKISLIDFTKRNRPVTRYEPELHPAAMYTMRHPKATVRVFATGSVTIFGPSVANVTVAIQNIYPLLSACRRPA
ncbi:unnamed protein product [Tetraodon nigroviridis]|uniref:(spotted green pufferfish) hypothetical protein n=1 Tax=Tetraodon nigroviridis TaxID=99883 RepID=Q4RR89_TETNG|nr:unnamed protein product [Tetraodon nigroviridis]